MFYCYSDDEPDSLIILAEEELVAIDLVSPEWPSYSAPYLRSLHNSAITCVAHATNLPEVLWDKIVDVGRRQFTDYSQRVSCLMVFFNESIAY